MPLPNSTWTIATLLGSKTTEDMDRSYGPVAKATLKSRVGAVGLLCVTDLSPNQKCVVVL